MPSAVRWLKRGIEAVEQVLLTNGQRGSRREPLGFVYLTLVLFMIIYFARPEDWIPGLSAIPLAKLAGIPMFLALLFSFGTIRWQFPWEIIFLTLLVFQLWLTVPFSPVWKGGAFFTMLDFVKVLPVVFGIFVAVRSPKRLRLILIVQATSVTLISIASVVQSHTRGGRLEGVLNGMYGNSNDLALAIDLCLPLCLALSLTSRSYVNKIGWTAAMLAMIYTVLLTASRAGALALAVVMLICLWQFGVKSGRTYLLLLVPFAVILIGLHSGQSLRERFTQMSTDSSKPNQSTSAAESAEQRKELLSQSLKITIHHPLFGVGPGNFPIVSGNWHVTHNSYTQISAEGGIPAFILYGLILWRAIVNLRSLRRYPKLGRQTRIFATALWASLAAYLVGSFFASVAYLLFPYCLVAYSTSLVQIARRERMVLNRASQADLAPSPIEVTA